MLRVDNYKSEHLISWFSKERGDSTGRPNVELSDSRVRPSFVYTVV